MTFSEYPGSPQSREFAQSLQHQKKRPISRNIAALILAAGQSRRMGHDNKLLLPYLGQTILSHILDQVKQAGINEIFVVTGHQNQAVTQEIRRHDVTLFQNDQYDEGMSTSIKLGIRSLPENIDAVLIILGDMPDISAGILRQIMAGYDQDQGRTIIIPTHGGRRGNPLMWGRTHFSEFEKLEGDKGAKTLLREYPENIYDVDVGSDAIFLDIDTFEAYERLNEE